MSLKINNKDISHIRFNKLNLSIGKINGSIIFKKDKLQINLLFLDKKIKIISNTTGDFDFYYSKNNNNITDYEPIFSLSLVENKEKTFNYLNNFNIAPYEANSISVCKKGSKQIISNSLLPENFIFDNNLYGEKKYSFGVLSDVHLDGDGTDEANSSSDFIRALNFFNSKTDFVCISGDICNENGYNELNIYKNIIDSNFSKPVYVSRGNHDCRYFLNDFNTYTNCDLYFEQIYNDDIFIFLGMSNENYGDSCFTNEELDWLETKLQTYINKRVFLFFHVFMPNTCGNINNLYPYSGLDTDSAIVQRFLTMMTNYKNVIYFSGHSHLEFNCQKFGANANIFYDGSTCKRVHTPSCAKPRKNDNGTTSTDTYEYNQGSEGYLVDVYDNCIVLKGIDFEKNKYIPIANYLLDTTIINANDDNLYDYSTANVLNAYISRSSKTIKESSGDNLTYINIEPNTTYKVTKVATNRFVIMTSVEEPAFDVVGTNEEDDYTGTELSITSGSSDNYLSIYYYTISDTLTEEEIRKSIVVTKME